MTIQITNKTGKQVLLHFYIITEEMWSEWSDGWGYKLQHTSHGMTLFCQNVFTEAAHFKIFN